ncbi:LOG family protein [Peterkaempfera sp. SMS 1(5)a]|uniref:LOG family protein n=1 Tax=Peterkaempfera podocarpi TaxID=3232308 RepID=UPI003671B33C
MKDVTAGVQASGGWLTGISVDFLRKWVRKDADDMMFARDLAERKARLLAVSGAVGVMPGGVGTPDEATEVLELRKRGPYDGPVVLPNTAVPHRLRYRGSVRSSSAAASTPARCSTMLDGSSSTATMPKGSFTTAQARAGCPARTLPVSPTPPSPSAPRTATAGWCRR